MKLALCQMRMSADEQTNLERGLDALHRAAAAGADLIVYPELQLHLFFPQYEGRDAADKLLTLESPIVRQFQDACRAEGIMAAPNFYPESIRTEALMGAALILIPTANTMAEPLELFDWEIRVQAFQSSVAVAMCNRTGLEGGMDFAGGSIVTDANGDVIAKAGPGEELLFAEVDMAAPARIRAARP